MILELLDSALPAPRRGTRVLDRALEAAGLERLPSTNVELKQFVRSALRGVLEQELGTALAREISADVESALVPALRRCDTSPAVPSSKRLRQGAPISRPGVGISVVLVGSDRLVGASLARILISEGFEVATARDDAEIAIAGKNARVLVLDERTVLSLPDSIADLLASRPELAILTYNCSNLGITTATLRAHGAMRTVALPSGASTREVISALSQLATDQ